MSITFQENIEPKPELHSAGSLLIGALFGGLTSEVGQAVDTASDTAEVTSGLHKDRHNKIQHNNFQLGQKNSLGGAFQAHTNELPNQAANNKPAKGMDEMRTMVQNRFYNMPPPTPKGMGMSMAA